MDASCYPRVREILLERGLRHRVLPHDTPLDEVLSQDLQRQAALRAEEPCAHDVRVVTLDDAIAVSRRHSRLLADHRRSIGFLTEREVLAFVTDPAHEASARRIWREFQRLVASHRDAGQGAEGTTDEEAREPRVRG
jgi:hypothetical protein